MAHDHEEPGYEALRVKALESLLVEKGLVASDAVDRLVAAFEQDIGPLSGARVVARAWADPAYKERLLADATPAIAELGISGMQGENMVALENTAEIHNVVVCTLCSCYPWPVLGLPPTWYKAPAYRARIVVEPRAVLSEMGLDLDESVEVRVWDSSAEIRYLVVPERPAGTEDLPEKELAGLVTRDSMIGVATIEAPRLMRSDVAEMQGTTALPRKNGELLFEEPWESRAFGIAVTASESGAFEWEEFRQELIAEIAAWEEEHGRDHAEEGGDWHYYERWLASLGRLLEEKGIVTPDELAGRMHVLEHEDDHDHHHDHEGGH